MVKAFIYIVTQMNLLRFTGEHVEVSTKLSLMESRFCSLMSLLFLFGVCVLVRSTFGMLFMF